jgi:penicillin-binding protein 2
VSPRDRRGPRGAGGLSAGGWAPQLTPRTAVRIAILGAIAMSLLGLLLVRLWFLQVISGEDYAAAAESNRLRTVITEAPRGNILDRNGDVLVANRPGKNVVVHPRDLTGSRREEVLARLAPKLHLPVGELIKKVDDGDSRPLEPVVLAENVAPRLYYYLAQRRRQYPGVGLENTYLRTYPQGDLAAHVLGQVGKIGADDIDAYRRRGYAGNETVGKGGIEQEYEQFLKGTPGKDVVEVDAAGEPVGREVVSSQAPSPGHDIQLSIDGPTQRAMQDALREQVSLGSSTGAAGVALDPATGEVLAMASYPTYDPSVFVDGTTKQIDRVNTSPDTPALNRAIGGRYPSGSTFKVITASAALQAGYITPGELVDSPAEVTLYKQVFPNFKHIAHGEVDLPRALEVSSDTYFYKLGDRFYRAQGSPLQAEAEDFGLGRDTGIDLPGEEPGLVPTPAWKRRNYAGPAFNDLDRDWKPGDTIQLAVGQGFLLATPLQMAVAYAAVADGGVVRTPTLARRVQDPNGRVVQELSQGRPTHKLDVSAGNLTAIRQGLYEAANGPDGTSTGVFGGLPEKDRVAGKTGTAEVEGGADHSWFVGYAPFNDPKIVVAIVVERGGTGANAAAPAVCRTMAAFRKFDPARCGETAVAN